MLRYGQEAPAFSLPSTSGRDISLAEFKGASDVVLGISGATPSSHAEFHRRHALPFPLLSDVHRRVIKVYGVWDAGHD